MAMDLATPCMSTTPAATVSSSLPTRRKSLLPLRSCFGEHAKTGSPALVVNRYVSLRFPAFGVGGLTGEHAPVAVDSVPGQRKQCRLPLGTLAATRPMTAWRNESYLSV